MGTISKRRGEKREEILAISGDTQRQFIMGQNVNLPIFPIFPTWAR